MLDQKCVYKLRLCMLPMSLLSICNTLYMMLWIGSCNEKRKEFPQAFSNRSARVYVSGTSQSELNSAESDFVFLPRNCRQRINDFPDIKVKSLQPFPAIWSCLASIRANQRFLHLISSVVLLRRFECSIVVEGADLELELLTAL